MFGKTGENNPMFGKVGENHPMFGKTHSAETLAKMSEAKYGEKNPFYGRTHSAETLAKLNKKVFVYTFDSVSKEKLLFKSFNNISEAAVHFKCNKRTLFNYIDKNKLYKKQWMLSYS
jgi:group I intron endonuclease